MATVLGRYAIGGERKERASMNEFERERYSDQECVDIFRELFPQGFIADELNRQTGQTRYGYMDFFMGTSWIMCRTDVTVIYEMIFKRLREQQLD